MRAVDTTHVNWELWAKYEVARHLQSPALTGQKNTVSEQLYSFFALADIGKILYYPHTNGANDGDSVCSK